MGILVQEKVLKTFAIDLLMAAGVPHEAAGQCAAGLVMADLEGLSSHGVSRLPLYLAAIERGQIDPAGAVQVEVSGPATAVVKGGNALGQVVAVAAMEEAIRLARLAGVGMVAARHSNHYGTAAYYVEMAAQAGFIGISTTNSPAAIPPAGGREAYLGTNPIAFGFPTASDPVIVDLSLSVVARGKVIQAARTGQPIPPGWSIDKEGRDTTDPKAALAGAMLPLGGPKGFALALAVEVLSGVLSGAAFGPHVTSILEQETSPANVGHWFVAIDIARFVTPAFFSSQLEILLQELKAAPRAEGVAAIRIPGEKRAALRRQLLADGLTLPDETVQALRQWADKLGVTSVF